MTTVVYFSSVSGNTHRFVEKVTRNAKRIPLFAKQAELVVTEPFTLILPSYGAGDGSGAVPKQVIRFLNNEKNRGLLRAVVGAGNTNFGSAYCLAARIIARKCLVPVAHTFEILGTPHDVKLVQEGLESGWKIR